MTNRQIVDQAYQAFGRGDLPALLGLLDPQVEWVNPGPSGLAYFGTHRGPDAIARNVFGFLAENFSFEVFEPREFFEGETGICVRLFMRARVRRNDRVVEQHVIHQFSFEAGKIARFHDFQNSYAIAEALSGS
jgi:ketosteroid isomerase-like protein